MPGRENTFIKYYRDSLAKIGQFPERLKPVSIFSDIDLKNRFLSYDRLNDEIRAYKLSLFRPSEYVHPEFRGSLR